MIKANEQQTQHLGRIMQYSEHIKRTGLSIQLFIYPI